MTHYIDMPADTELIDLTADDDDVHATTQQRKLREDWVMVGRSTAKSDSEERSMDAQTCDDEDDDIVALLSTLEIKEWKTKFDNRDSLPSGHRYRRLAVSPTGAEIKVDNTVELDDGTFLLVRHIIEEPGKLCSLKGLSLVRAVAASNRLKKRETDSLPSLFPKKINEVYMSLLTRKGQLGDLRDPECLVQVPLSRVQCRRELIVTNASFPMYSTESLGLRIEVDGQDWIEDHARLCCRWKLVEEVDYGSKTVSAFPLAQLARIREHEADPKYAVSDVELRKAYGCRLQRNLSTSLLQKRYKYADVCAGGGGTSCGAALAGLELCWAIDKERVAVQTLRLNGLYEFVLEMDIGDFLDESKRVKRLEDMGRYDLASKVSGDVFIVDILHVSFPCQGHSWANRGQNPSRDMKNNETSLVLADLITLVRPRILTMEQTSGITSKNEGWWYAKHLGEITSMHYSVRWKVVNMVRQGVPSFRKRLMTIAACPGQQLPPWPPETHGYEPHLIPPVTYYQAVADIPAWATHHDVEELKARFRIHPRSLPVQDGNMPIKNIIMTSGASFLDPSGLHWPTIRQQMRLMGFPDEYCLEGYTQTEWTTMIGNAVPVEFMRVLFVEIIKTLRESDNETAAYDAKTPITLDSDDEDDVKSVMSIDDD